MRFYEQKFPEKEDLVMVEVKQIQEMGAYVKLLEYDNIEGMILLSELSRRRIRSIQKLIRVGRNEVVVVMRVDREKGYIDLSKRRVSPEDVIKCEERYGKAKVVHQIVRQTAEKADEDFESLNDRVTWPLYQKYGHAYEAFKMALMDPDSILSGLDISPNTLPVLISQIARRLTPQAVKIRADIELTCFGYNGIEAIRSALKQGEKVGTPTIPIKITLVAPPLYVLVSNATDKGGALEALQKAIEVIREEVQEHGGELNVKSEPRIVGEQEDLQLEAALKEHARENEEVAGDSESGED